MKDTRTALARKPVSPRPRSKTGPPRRILVVEDDSCIRNLSTEALIRSGYEVDAAEDGAVAWQALNTDSYDLMITDNNMPRLTGVDLLKKLRSARMSLPVIMATAALPTHEFALCPWLIPDAALLKPFTMGELLGKVKEVLDKNDRAAGSAGTSPMFAEGRD